MTIVVLTTYKPFELACKYPLLMEDLGLAPLVQLVVGNLILIRCHTKYEIFHAAKCIYETFRKAANRTV